MRPPIFFGVQGASLLAVISFWAVFYGWVFSEIWLSWKRRSGPGATTNDRGSKWPLIAGVWAAVALGIGLGLGFPATAIIAAREGLFATGLAIMLAGLALRWYSILLLGRSFTVDVATRPGQEVVTSGPYRWIRHPSYTGALLTVLGILVCCLNWLSLVAFPLAVAGYVYRIRVEEAVLANGLGETYRAYMRRTRRLIPFIV